MYYRFRNRSRAAENEVFIFFAKPAYYVKTGDIVVIPVYFTVKGTNPLAKISGANINLKYKEGHLLPIHNEKQTSRVAETTCKNMGTYEKLLKLKNYKDESAKEFSFLNVSRISIARSSSLPNPSSCFAVLYFKVIANEYTNKEVTLELADPQNVELVGSGGTFKPLFGEKVTIYLGERKETTESNVIKNSNPATSFVNGVLGAVEGFLRSITK